MVKQYPHYLYYKQLSGDSYQDDDNNWVTPDPTWALHSMCREETNGAGRQINGIDGKAIVFSSSVYMPKDTVKIPEGTEILVSGSDSEYEVGKEQGPIRVKGTILKFDPNQLNCRLWV